MEISWKLHDDGSFDIMTNNEIALKNCYPGIDEWPVRAINKTVTCSITGGTITYQLIDGWVRLDLNIQDGCLILDSTLCMEGKAPRYFAPLAQAQVSGANRYFKMHNGISGDSGFHSLPVKNTDKSFAMSGVISSKDQILLIASRDFSRFTQETLFYSNRHCRGNLLESGFNTEYIPINKGQLKLPSLFLSCGNEIWSTLRKEALHSTTYMHARNTMAQTYHWCSWYYLYSLLSENILDEYLKGFISLPDKAGLQTVQIDAGYCMHLGDWLEPNHLWVKGLQVAAQKITSSGFKAGIWIGPYMVGSRSRLFKEHPDWILKNVDGGFVTPWKQYGEGRPMCLLDEESYVLDTSHPQAFQYLRTVFRTLRSWGFTFYKTDFMLWAMEESNKVVRFTPGKTCVEYFRETAAMIREEIGDDSFWLGCIAPYAPFVGFADAMRISADISPHVGSALDALVESTGLQHVNNAWFQNDPDAIVLRAQHNFKSEPEVYSDAYWIAMLGGAINTSDPLHMQPADRLALWRFLEPGTRKWTSRIPHLGRVSEKDHYFGLPCELNVQVREYGERKAWAVLFMNAQSRNVKDLWRMSDIIGKEMAYVWSWGPAGSEYLGEWTQFILEIVPRGCVLYYVSEVNNGPGKMTLGGLQK